MSSDISFICYMSIIKYPLNSFILSTHWIHLYFFCCSSCYASCCVHKNSWQMLMLESDYCICFNFRSMFFTTTVYVSKWDEMNTFLYWEYCAMYSFILLLYILSNLHVEEYICSWFPLAPCCIIIYLCLSYPIYLLLALCSMFPLILFWALFCVTLPLHYNMSLMPKVLNIDAGWESDESVPSIDLCWLSRTGTIMLVKKKKN